MLTATLDQRILKAHLFSELERAVQNATIQFVPCKGRIITSSDYPGSVELALLSDKVQSLFARHCPATERGALSNLISKITEWYAETRKVCEKESSLAQIYDWAIYGTFINKGRDDYWNWEMKGSGPLLSHCYTEKEWAELFPKKQMPKTSRIGSRWLVFS